MIDSAPTEAWQTPASSENQVVYWFLVGKFSYILLTTRLIPKTHRPGQGTWASMSHMVHTFFSTPLSASIYAPSLPIFSHVSLRATQNRGIFTGTPYYTISDIGWKN